MKKEFSNLRKKFTSLALSAALVASVIPAGTGLAFGASNFGYSDATSSATPKEVISPSTTADVTAAGSFGAPTGLKTVTRDEDEIALSWNPVNGAEGYEVYRYSSANGQWIKIATTYEPYDEIDNLLSAAIYSFKVRAFARDAAGNYKYSDFSEAFKTVTSPKDVDNLRVSSKTSSSVTLKWNAVKRADKYQVYRYNRNTGSWKLIATTTSTTYKATGLSAGTSYKFRVRPYREALGYKYYGDYDSITVTTSRGTNYNTYNYNTQAGGTTSTGSGLIGESRAKQIALNKAGVSQSNVDYIYAYLDYDDGIRVYDVKFYTGNYEYEAEINARTGAVYDFDRDYRWD